MSRDLERRVANLEKMNRQPVRRHNTSSKQSDLLRRDPSKVKASDLDNLNLRQFINAGTAGIMFRIDGKNYKIEATEI